MKQWLDLVLEHGWAYGRTGRALAGKRMMQAVSTGGLEEAYRPNGFHGYRVAELLRPFEQTATLCRMSYLPPFVVHGSFRMDEQKADRGGRTIRRSPTVAF